MFIYLSIHTFYFIFFRNLIVSIIIQLITKQLISQGRRKQRNQVYRHQNQLNQYIRNVYLFIDQCVTFLFLFNQVQYFVSGIFFGKILFNYIHLFQIFLFLSLIKSAKIINYFSISDIDDLNCKTPQHIYVVFQAIKLILIMLKLQQPDFIQEKTQNVSQNYLFSCCNSNYFIEYSIFGKISLQQSQVRE
ncbi:hypothetical protein ABPG74_005541 [Tetrahymena malaccensis]